MEISTGEAIERTGEPGALLFCPFCREAFEGEERCPEHDLALVAWLDLPRPRAEPDPHAPLAWYSPRMGRAWVASGAGLALVAFAFGSIASVASEPALDGGMLALALRSAPKLWLVPASAFAALSILWRRRSPRAMRAARLAVAFLAVVPPLAAAWTWRGIERALALLGARTGQALEPRLELGAYLLVLAACSMLVGAMRLGAGGRER